jgi:flagellum-specific peptidoglycan hydrolase FlgJ
MKLIKHTKRTITLRTTYTALAHKLRAIYYADKRVLKVVLSLNLLTSTLTYLCGGFAVTLPDTTYASLMSTKAPTRLLDPKLHPESLSRKWLTNDEWRGKKRVVTKAAKSTYMDDVLSDASVFTTLAERTAKHYKIPRGIVMAQLILESNFGTTKLAIEGNNFFGHKWNKKTKGEGIVGNISEYDDCGSEKCLFRKYESRWYGFHWHGKVLERYKQGKDYTNADYKEFAKCLCGETLGTGSMNYATSCNDKGNPYWKALIKVIEDYELY